MSGICSFADKIENTVINSMNATIAQVSDKSSSICSQIESIQETQEESKKEISNVRDQVLFVQKQNETSYRETKMLLETVLKRAEEIDNAYRNSQDKNLESLERHSKNILDGLSECEERIVDRVTSETMGGICSFTDKIENTVINSMNATITQINDKSSSICNQIESIQENQEESKEDIRQLLESITNKLEDVERTSHTLYKKNNETITNELKGILLNLEEVRSLIQIIAVNNLLDDIQVK